MHEWKTSTRGFQNVFTGCISCQSQERFFFFFYRFVHVEHHCAVWGIPSPRNTKVIFKMPYNIFQMLSTFSSSSTLLRVRFKTHHFARFMPGIHTTLEFPSHKNGVLWKYCWLHLNLISCGRGETEDLDDAGKPHSLRNWVLLVRRYPSMIMLLSCDPFLKWNKQH